LNCKICNRKAGERDFCPLHLKAYENILKKYDFWRKALNISWKDYISEIEKNALTGESARDATKYLINNEETKNATKN
jgi:hypothetical protein